MKRTFILFLLCIFLCSFLSFGAIIFLNYTFLDVFKLPIPTLLFIFGGLFPGIFGYTLASQENKVNLFKAKNINSIVLMFVYIVIHVSLYNLFGLLKPTSDTLRLFLSIPISIIIFGLQEIGWIELVFKRFEEEKGYIRSIMIVGLFKALSFMPLLLLRGFPAHVNFLTFFAALIIGISALSISVYKNSKALYQSVILVGVIYGIMASVNLNQGLTMVLISVIECGLVYYLQDFLKK